LPAAAAGPPAAGPGHGITAEIDAAAAWEHDKSRNYLQTPIIFALRRDCPSFDHERGSDRQALRQTAKLVT
jgi:hypothetical protein